MSTIKTVVRDDNVEDFIRSIPNVRKQADTFSLLELYTAITGESAKMWGPSMIGFGMYHYKSDRSAQEGDWPLAAFSPRKQHLVLYIMPGLTDYSDLLEKLGKHKTSKACLYINKLSDVNLDALRQLLQRSYADAIREFAS